MTRLGAVFWMILVLAAGFTTFKVKYAVQDIEDELGRVRKQTVAEQQEIRVLTAEWTYLNQPERLTELNRRFLGLTPMTTKQLQRGIDEIPLRAPAAPSSALVAASTDLAAPEAASTPEAAAPALPVTPAAPGPAPELAATEAKHPQGDGPHPPADAAPVQLATAGPAQAANSLDALIAQIVETR